MNCDAFTEPLNALLDGELPPEKAAAVTAHIAGCPACAELFSELAQLRADLATLIPEEEVPAGLQSRIEAMLNAEENSVPVAANVIPLLRKSGWRRSQNYGWVAAVTAIAAMLMLTVLPRHSDIDALMSVRDAALRSELSNNQSGNPQGPAIPGFQLTSFRNDQVAGHPARVAQYTAHGQVFTLCIWPAYDEPPHSVQTAAYQGMTISSWADGNEEYWAASTAPAAQLQAFVAKVSS